MSAAAVHASAATPAAPTTLTAKQERDSELLLIRARARLIIAYPFFGSLALKLMLHQSARVPTLATDGRMLHYNPLFVLSLPAEQLLGVVVHEVMHCAAGHPWRRDEREQKRWNVAADLAINPMITENGFVLPTGALDGEKFHGMSAEEIYSKLPDEMPQRMCGCGGLLESNSSNSDGDSSGSDDSSSVGTRLTAAEAAALESEWRIAVSQAVVAAQSAGNVPASIERWAETRVKSSVDWRSVLRRFITARAMDDYRSFPPNRRFIQQGLYLPSCRSERCGEIVVGIDTSGSIGQRELDAFAGELNAILEDVRPTLVHVVYCDAAVAATETFTAEQYPVTLTAKGGGGTAFGPVFEWVENNNIQPEALVYLTDLDCYGAWPEQPNDYPVLWAATTETKVAPWGETVAVIIDRQA